MIVWQKSHKAAMIMLKLAEKADRRSITYEIWKQVIRSAFSVPANIAEGFNSHKGKTYISHLQIAKGSCGETDYWLIVLFESREITSNNYTELNLLNEEVSKMLAVTLKSLALKTTHYPLTTTSGVSRICLAKYHQVGLGKSKLSTYSPKG